MKKLNLPFAALLGAVLLIHWPYLSSKIIPIHDTLYVFTFFYPFYNEWYFFHEIVQWFPHSTYGLPANFYQLWAMTPVHYLIMLIGALLKFPNALIIFKMGILSEIVLYVLGLYWLGREVYTDKRTIVLVCFSGLATVAWNSNINVGFRYFYLFPLIAYFLVLFYKQRRPEFIWIAGIAALLWWVQGSVLYHVMPGIFAFFIFLGFLFLTSKNLWRVPFQASRNNVLFFLLFAAILAFFAFYLKQALSHVSFFAPGRSAESGVTTVEAFLTYGGTADWGKLFHGFFFASPPFFRVGTHQDTAIYLGVVMIVFFIWALVRVRSTLFMAFLVTAAALTWLSFGGNFAKLCYYFPGMAFYRHLGFVAGLVKVIVLICAGFGLDEFWKLSLAKKKHFAAVSLWAFIFMIVLFKDVRQDFGKHWGWINEKLILGDFHNPYAVMLLAGCVLLALLLCAMFFNKKKIGALLFCILVTFNFCDFFIFQGRIYDNVPQVPAVAKDALSSLNVHPWEYQQVRLRDPVTERQKNAWKLVRLSPMTAKYGTSFSFIGLDHCDPVYRPDIVTDGVLQLVTIPNVKTYLIGCFYPKMRLVNDFIAFDDPKTAALAIASLPGPQAPVIINKLKPGYKEESVTNDLSAANIAEVKDFRFNELTAEVLLGRREGAWLVYDDAYHPNWRAEVNGREVPVQQAYFAFKAVRVPPGKSTVRFFYDPKKSVPSVILSVINLIFALIYLIVLIRTLFNRSILHG